MAAYSWEAMLAHIARRLSDLTETKISPDELTAPPDPKLGDAAFGCFKLAKSMGKPPAEIAKLLASKMDKADPTIESASAAGPYLNIKVKSGELISRVVKDVIKAKGAFGKGEEGAGKSLLLEYAQPNTHKEFHIGHLRNVLIGSSLDRVLRMAGWKVVPVSYHGDVGAHVAKCLWFLVRAQAHIIKQPTPKKPKKGKTAYKVLSADEWIDAVLATMDDDKANLILISVPRDDHNGRYLGRLYSESTKLLEENPDWKSQVSDVQQKLEAQAPGWSRLWAETRRWSMDELGEIFQEIGVQIERMYFESEVVAEGQRMVDVLVAKGIARESQGAIIVDLEEDKLGTLVVRKSDGTSLYATKDLALAVKKSEEYPTVTRSLHVVDHRQEFYFKQLFRVLGLMGYRMPLEYVGYEVVTLTTGAMSSRQGNVVTWEAFRDEVLAAATAEAVKRHPDWVEGRVSHTAWCIAMGAIKFGMLKQDSDKIFTFDLARSLSFDGDTGPYIQYAATRLTGILKKAGKKAPASGDIDPNLLDEPAEKHLALHVAAFPAACRKAAEELRPAVIAQWCVTMASRVNEFYRDVSVSESKGDKKTARLQLVTVAHDVLGEALNLLGIPLPDEM